MAIQVKVAEANEELDVVDLITKLVTVFEATMSWSMSAVATKAPAGIAITL
jgi:hypothetical protein